MKLPICWQIWGFVLIFIVSISMGEVAHVSSVKRIHLLLKNFTHFTLIFCLKGK